MGIVAAIFVGTLSFLGTVYFTSTNPEKYLSIIITVNILIITLFIWRYYAHIIDNDIVKCYKKIIFCEYQLNIPKEISLFSSLEKDISRNVDIMALISKQSVNIRYLIIQKLIDKNRIGYRHHFLWDLIVILSTLALFFSQLGYVLSLMIDSVKMCFTGFSIDPAILLLFFFMLPLFYLGLSICLIFDLPHQGVPIQRDPTLDDIQKIINEIDKSKV